MSGRRRAPPGTLTGDDAGPRRAWRPPPKWAGHAAACENGVGAVCLQTLYFGGTGARTGVTRARAVFVRGARAARRDVRREGSPRRDVLLRG